MNIFADSTGLGMSMISVALVRLFRLLWKRNCQYPFVKYLLDAILLPKRLALIKCFAHKRTDDPITRRHAFADEVATKTVMSLSMPFP